MRRLGLPRGFEPWSASQRGAMIAILVGITLYLTVRLVIYPAYVSDPQPEHPPREQELADRIDPNTADWQELSALPLIGDKKAQDIVAYREQYMVQNHSSIAFSTVRDLMNIRGIGTATTQQLEPYLIFPGQRFITAPSTEP